MCFQLTSGTKHFGIIFVTQPSLFTAQLQGAWVRIPATSKLLCYENALKNVCPCIPGLMSSHLVDVL